MGSRLVTIMTLLSPNTTSKTKHRQFKLKKFDKPKLTFKKFCLFFFFAAFATHLVYLGELAQIKYTTVRNKSIHYSQFVEEFLHAKNRSEVMKNRTEVMRYYYPKQKKVPTKVILISSNPRSGSSYVGEVLSAMPGVSYFFEPLWLMAKANKSLEEPINKKIEFVSKLLNCQYQTLSKKLLNNLKARAFVFKKPDLGQTQLKTLPLLEKRHFLTSIRQNCQKNSLRLTKLFRLRMSDILVELENPESSSLGPDFKVILLQRDPRATINSLKREIHEWLPGAASPQKICGNLYEDYTAVIQMKNRVMQNRILTLKYEDMVLEPYLTTSKLYQFINASKEDLKYAYAYIQSHSQLQEDSQSSEEEARSLTKAALGISLTKRKIRLESQWRLGQLSRIEFEKAKKNSSYVPISPKEFDIKRQMRIQKYYDTHRSRDFQHDHWKHELSNETLREIMTEPLCQKVLKMLDYPL